MKKKKKILVLAANPKDTTRLRFDEEVREINEGLRRSKYRDQFETKTWLAVRTKDIRRAMLEYEPDIVHFCGHGEKDGLMVEDESGQAVLIQLAALSGLFELFAGSVKCVVLNAGHSQLQAEAINRHINVVIGMSREIDSTAAAEFAVGFYDALGAGEAYEKAFEFGQNAVLMNDIPASLVPVLYARQHTGAPPPTKSKKVFLCHAHKDKTLYAESLARGLKNHGVDVWIDEGAIKPGESLFDKISRGIGECDYFVVLLTPNSIDSRWVNLELNLAFEKFKNETFGIIPAVFGSCVIPVFLSSFPYVDFRKFFAYGLKELLMIFNVPSRLLSEADTKKLLLKVFGSESRELIKKYVLVNDNSRAEAVKDIIKDNLKYVIPGVLMVLLGLSGSLTRLLSAVSSPLAVAVSFGLILWGLFFTAKYFGAKSVIERYFKRLSRFELLIRDLEPDILVKDPGALYYEFLDENDKRFYRKHRIDDNDLYHSIIICKRRYLLYLLLLFLAFIGFEVFARTLAVAEMKNTIGLFRLGILFLVLFQLAAYKHQVKRIRGMVKLRQEFETLKNLFTGSKQ